jgi:squalene-hopene/tetraprenyl-beta-curcumene cyclase
MTPKEQREPAELLRICYSFGEKVTRTDDSQCDRAARPHLHVQRGWRERLDEAVASSCDFLLKTQHPDGYWWLELESNVTITAEYLMMFHLLGCVDRDREKRIVRHLLRQQHSEGHWGLFYEDGGDVSTTVEAYFALKLAGEDPNSPRLRKARDFIIAGGGIESTRVFTKIWLALFGQYDWDKVASMPVEMMLAPAHLPLNIYEFSSWARSTVVPLAITMAIRPTLELPPHQAIAELYLAPNDNSSMLCGPPLHKLFYLADRVLKFYEKHPLRDIRRRAMKAAEDWILEHQEDSGDWGGIQPAMVNSILALHYLGYPTDHPAMVRGLQALENFCIDDADGLRLQACVSPVWDTALNALALLDAGVPPDHPGVEKAAIWLIENQVTTGGDWQVKCCGPPGGWAFEFNNSHYPDVDDSAVVLMALQRLHPDQHCALEAVRNRGLEWCLSMQSESGGWAAFDKDNTLTFLNWIPFADHGAMVDYPTADITGRMLEAMAAFGYDRSHPRARRGIKFIRDCQEKDGCWWGRWGVNYIYGTWSVLRGLIGIGEDPKQRYIKKSVRWLKDHQNPDGGWGETCESYTRPELRGKGPSTPSQTAWALMGLMEGGEAECREVRKGIQYLIDRQQPDGSWEELYFTGTGFPKHFFIRYHDYCNCFPLMALGKYHQALSRKG